MKYIGMEQQINGKTSVKVSGFLTRRISKLDVRFLLAGDKRLSYWRQDPPDVLQAIKGMRILAFAALYLNCEREQLLSIAA
jgi:hypothetical protein